MNVHDAVVAYRRRIVRAVDAALNRRAKCVELGIHHSTYYRWRNKVDDPVAGPQRRIPFVDQVLEQKVVAFSLAHPALGPQRISDELGVQGVVVGPSRVWRILCRNSLNTRQLRYRLLDTHRRPPEPQITVVSYKPEAKASLKAELPGDLIQFDTFHVGSFKETRLGRDKTAKGQIWQHTAIDVASSYLWVELETTPQNPTPAVASKLAHLVAQDLTNWEWSWKAATTDNGNEYRAQLFRDTLQTLGVEHRYIKAGRPQTNGKAERVQGTLLEEFYQPTLIGYVQPSITGLRTDLNAYVHHYNWNRPHRGKWNKGDTPATIIQPKTKIITP
jgi:transposase InsO family protein